VGGHSSPGGGGFSQSHGFFGGVEDLSGAFEPLEEELEELEELEEDMRMMKVEIKRLLKPNSLDSTNFAEISATKFE